jgi:CPA1 family monovalent cation:H+ antiporter
LIYRLAVGAAATGSFSAAEVAPAFLLAVAGSLVAGPALGWLLLRSMAHVRHVPTVIILQFITTFAVWIIAEHLHLSAVLTTVCFAIFVAQSAPQRTPARLRIPAYAVWETTVFAINILAFIFIGLQIRPILASLEPGETSRFLVVAGAVLLTVIIVRFAWHMPFNAVIRWRDRAVGFHPPRPMLRATVGSGVLISWAGMRGIVSLATALALPIDFPFRGLIVLTAFCVVLGTLVIQGLTLKPLLRVLDLHDDDPVGHEVQAARARALEAALARCGDDQSAIATTIRKEFKVQLMAGGPEAGAIEAARLQHAELRADALRAARDAVFAMRAGDEIGDDAFHQVEEQLDWMEMAGGRREE